jgi:hypothetical protein
LGQRCDVSYFSDLKLYTAFKWTFLISYIILLLWTCQRWYRLWHIRRERRRRIFSIFNGIPLNTNGNVNGNGQTHYAAATTGHTNGRQVATLHAAAKRPSPSPHHINAHVPVPIVAPSLHHVRPTTAVTVAVATTAVGPSSLPAGAIANAQRTLAWRLPSSISNSTITLPPQRCSTLINDSQWQCMTLSLISTICIIILFVDPVGAEEIWQWQRRGILLSVSVILSVVIGSISSRSFVKSQLAFRTDLRAHYRLHTILMFAFTTIEFCCTALLAVTNDDPTRIIIFVILVAIGITNVVLLLIAMTMYAAHARRALEYHIKLGQSVANYNAITALASPPQSFANNNGNSNNQNTPTGGTSNAAAIGDATEAVSLSRSKA